MVERLIVGVVGPCAAGKSTLIAGLKQQGYDARHIAQEHSYVQDMWLRLTNPNLLIYLDVSYPVSLQRRLLNWTVGEYEDQLQRLRHARENADYYIFTDSLSISEVLGQVLAFLNKKTDRRLE